MGGKSTPKAPDYEAAAAKQAESSREVTEQQTWANRPDQYTPWGSTTWENSQQWDPSTQQWLNRWSQNTQLDPLAQEALDSQMRLTRDRSQLGESLTGRMQSEYGTAMDFSGLPEMGGVPQAGNLTPEQLQRGYQIAGPELDPSQKYSQRAEEALYGKWASRAMPAQAEAEKALRARLSNQGLREGDAAYDNELAKLRMSNADAQQQAAFSAATGAGAEAQRYLGMDAATRAQLTGENAALAQFGNQAATGQFGMESQAGAQNFGQQMQSSQYQTQQRQQALAEAMQRRGWTLNEINALMSGQQVGMPSMPSFSQAQRAEGNQALQAAQMTGQAALDAFNAKQAATQGMMSGIGSIAGAMPMSDRRLKVDIEDTGERVNDLALYAFRYVWDRADAPKRVGFMADEVARTHPQAIGHVGRYLRVDYLALV